MNSGGVQGEGAASLDGPPPDTPRYDVVVHDLFTGGQRFPLRTLERGVLQQIKETPLLLEPSRKLDPNLESLKFLQFLKVKLETNPFPRIHRILKRHRPRHLPQ